MMATDTCTHGEAEWVSGDLVASDDSYLVAFCSDCEHYIEFRLSLSDEEAELHEKAEFTGIPNGA